MVEGNVGPDRDSGFLPVLVPGPAFLGLPVPTNFSQDREFQPGAQISANREFQPGAKVPGLSRCQIGLKSIVSVKNGYNGCKTNVI